MLSFSQSGDPAFGFIFLTAGSPLREDDDSLRNKKPCVMRADNVLFTKSLVATNEFGGYQSKAPGIESFQSLQLHCVLGCDQILA